MTSRSIVIEDVKDAFCAEQTPPPAFFYCSRNPSEPGRSNPANILASVVRQLSCLEPGLPLLDPVVTAYKKRETQGFASGALRIDESVALILQLVERYPLTTIVIDALDECHPTKRADLLDGLETILQHSPSLVKLFVSSRDDGDIVCQLSRCPNLYITPERNGNDIEAFVKTETKRLIERGRLLCYSSAKEELALLIIEKVTQRAAGM
jgi:hypothetical protein